MVTTSILQGPPTQTGIPSDDISYLPIRQLPQVKSRLGFSRSYANPGVDPANLTIVGQGGAMSVSQASSSLVMASGTTARQETIVRSTASWKDSLNLKFGLSASQRIVNCSFFVELVDVVGDGLAYSITSATSITVTFPTQPFATGDVGKTLTLGNFAGTGTFLSGPAVLASFTGVTATFTVAGFAVGAGTCSAWGLNYLRTLYDGASVTAAKFGSSRNGWPMADVAVVTNTTAAPGHDVVMNAEDDISYMLDALTTSSTALQFTARGSIRRNLPDGGAPLFLQIRLLNGSTAPVSTTTYTLAYVDIENYATQQVSMTSVRPQGPGAALPVQITSPTTLAISGTVTADTEMPAAGALADATANPTTSQVGADSMLFNGATWDRARNNANGVTGDTGAKTVTFNGATQTNYNNAGALITCLFGAVTGTAPTIALQLQWSPDAGTTWLNYGTAIAAFTPVATNTALLAIYPAQFEDATSTTLAAFTTGATQAKLLNTPLPRTWRIVYTIGGTTPSITITAVYVNYIL